MKKYFFGAIAMVFAIASVAFTTRTTEFYKYTGSTISDLDDETKWVLGEGTSCSSAGTACYVESAAADITAFRQLIINNRPQTLQAVEDITDVDVIAEKDASDD